MKNKINAIAIILGRKNSKTVKDKNVMKILRKKSFMYPFEAAKKSKYVNKIFFSTDHPEIIKFAKKNKIDFITRPKKFNTDKALFEDALFYSYDKISKKIGYDIKYVVVLMCNAITINRQLIDKGINLLIKNKKADSAVTVSKYNMYSPLRARKINSKGFLDPFVPLRSFGNISELNCDKDSQGDVYFADMSHSVTRGKTLRNMKNGLLPQKWMGKKILPVFNSYGCDIDAGWQISMSERWIKEKF